ncbi:TolC family protein [Chitinophaga tropicalis]|uniref:Transporter n=1 Tax=Chitinophaga tropicalis TaxID=2683588 RepID=A0A7K1U386_9BACT|nr:TolC family protein [Chitinophaga tropicalis]MVT08819.1 hypothetical protein [Chitinophaga tropicalis]
MKFRIKRAMRLWLLLTVAGITGLKSVKSQRILTLDECLKIAKENNNNIKAAQENVNAAREVKKQRDDSGKPTLDGSVMAFYFGRPVNTLLPEYGVSPGLRISQPVYSGGRTKLSRVAAAKGLEIQEGRKQLATSEVLFNTERAYWQVISAREQIKLAEQNKKQLDVLYNDLNNQYVAGIIYKNDVLRANVQLTENELELKRAEDALTIAQESLLQIIGLEDTTRVVIVDTLLEQFEVPVIAENMRQLISDNAELGILKNSIEAEKVQQQLMKADSRPAVSLGVNGIMSAGKVGINPANNSNVLTTYFGMLNVSIPIFDWGVRKRRIQEQQFRINAQSFQLKERMGEITTEARQAYLELNQDQKRIELSGVSLQQAEENLRLSKDRLKAGTITGRDVLEAQTIWQRAYSNMINAKIDRRIAEANLRRILAKGQP